VSAARRHAWLSLTVQAAAMLVQRYGFKTNGCLAATVATHRITSTVSIAVAFPPLLLSGAALRQTRVLVSK
jgi:hypothetical protein